MNRFASSLVLTILLTLIHSGLAAAGDKTKPAETKQPDIKSNVAKRTETPEVLTEVITFGPAQYFFHSREFYEKNDMKAAANELIKAASMLEIAAGWDRAKLTQDRLNTSAKDLREVAAALQKGQAALTLKKLEQAIAQANVSLSWYHFHIQGSQLKDLEGRDDSILPCQTESR